MTNPQLLDSPDQAPPGDQPSAAGLSGPGPKLPKGPVGAKKALAAVVLLLAAGVMLVKGPGLPEGGLTAFKREAVQDQSLARLDSRASQDFQAGGALGDKLSPPAGMPYRAEAPAVAQSKAKESMAASEADRPASLPPLGLPTVGDLGHGYNVPGYLIKQASMQLEVSGIQEAFGKITDLTERHKGYLVDSSLSNYAHGQPSATLHIKLPSERLSAALAELDALGIVRAKQIKTEDLWLQLKRQQLETAYLQGEASATKAGASKRAQQHQIALQQLERTRLEQMLRMATLELSLQQAPTWLDLSPLGEELRVKTLSSLQTTLRLLADVLLFAPPLLIFLGLAWLGWLLIRHVLVTRLALLAPRTLASVYLLALVFFPLYAVGPAGLGAVLTFGLLLGSIWALTTLARWTRARLAAQKAAPPQP